MKHPSLFSFLKKYKPKNSSSNTLDTTTESLDTTSDLFDDERDIINDYSESSDPVLDRAQDNDQDVIQMEYKFRFPKNYKIDQVTNYFFAMLMKFYQNILNKREKSNLFDKLEKHPKYGWYGWLSLKDDVLKSKSSSHILIGKGGAQRGRPNKLTHSSKIRSKRS